jgi:hypothetical protein
MPLTLNRKSSTADRVRAALVLRKKIDELERRFARTVANLPKHMLTRNVYGFSPAEMRKIAQKLHAKAKEEITSGRSRELRATNQKIYSAHLAEDLRNELRGWPKPDRARVGKLIQRRRKHLTSNITASAVSYDYRRSFQFDCEWSDRGERHGR